MIMDCNDRLTLEQSYHKLMQNNPAMTAVAAFRGDILAQKKYEELGELLGVAFANIANIVAPEVFVVGGGAVASSELFLESAKKTMLKHIASTEVRKRIKLVKSKLGPQAGAIGAALL